MCAGEEVTLSHTIQRQMYATDIPSDFLSALVLLSSSQHIVCAE